MDPKEKREFYRSLRERVYHLKMAYLFEEPCPLYEPGWEDFWDCRLTSYDYEEDEDV